MQRAVRFIRKNGKIIPIAAAAMGSSAIKGGTAAAVKHHLTKQGIKPVQANPYLKLGSELLVTAGGFASGTALKYGGKGLMVGAVADEAIGIGASAIGAAAYAGKGRIKERVAGVAKQELKLQALGWTAFAAGALSSPQARAKAAGYASKILAFSKKALRVA